MSPIRVFVGVSVRLKRKSSQGTRGGIVACAGFPLLGCVLHPERLRSLVGADAQEDHIDVASRLRNDFAVARHAASYLCGGALVAVHTLDDLPFLKRKVMPVHKSAIAARRHTTRTYRKLARLAGVEHVVFDAALLQSHAINHARIGESSTPMKPPMTAALNCSRSARARIAPML